jgi:hypothetical protein
LCRKRQAPYLWSQTVIQEDKSLPLKGKNMNKLQAYFESTKGVGVLATADSEGKVDAQKLIAAFADPAIMPF